MPVVIIIILVCVFEALGGGWLAYLVIGLPLSIVAFLIVLGAIESLRSATIERDERAKAAQRMKDIEKIWLESVALRSAAEELELSAQRTHVAQRMKGVEKLLLGGGLALLAMELSAHRAHASEQHNHPSDISGDCESDHDGCEGEYGGYEGECGDCENE